jgi:hypothetical protein
MLGRERKQRMGKTAEAIRVSSSNCGHDLAPLLTSALVAKWQPGPQTLSGYEQRKLRLVLSPAGGANELTNNRIDGVTSYAIR